MAYKKDKPSPRRTAKDKKVPENQLTTSEEDAPPAERDVLRRMLETPPRKVIHRSKKR